MTDDEWRQGEVEEEVKVQAKVDNIKKAVTMEETSEQLSQKSKDLFDEFKITKEYDSYKNNTLNKKF